jgi:hypothetical protein
MENLPAAAPPVYEEHPRRWRGSTSSSTSESMARTSKLQIGSQVSAMDRSRKFCFRYTSLLCFLLCSPRLIKEDRTQFKNFEAVADIIVGPEKTKFKLHKDVAAAHSPFFAAALNGKFVEGETGQIILPDVEPKIFEHIVLWFYTRRLEESSAFYKDDKPTYFTLLDIYGLADQLCIEGLRNAVVDFMAELADQTNSVPTPLDSNLLYENIRDNAPIRRLVLELFAFKKTDNLVATHPDEWHPTFLRELIWKLKRPGYSALMRHDLRRWRPSTWNDTKACEICKVVLKPDVSSNICGGCNRAFCCSCVGKGLGGGGDGGGLIDWSLAERECKPWSSPRGKCEYHEHAETERCDLRGYGRGTESNVPR